MKGKFWVENEPYLLQFFSLFINEINSLVPRRVSSFLNVVIGSNLKAVGVFETKTVFPKNVYQNEQETISEMYTVFTHVINNWHKDYCTMYV